MTNSPYELVCGLEVHAELKTNSKMFCGCKNDPFLAPAPNIYTCPVCLGMPGGIPVPNKRAIEWTIKLGLALHCEINLFSKFDRKNYFYPDLAKGYQISQYDIPFCHDGWIETSQGKIGIQRIHLEEDTGKLQHTSIDGQKVSLIDFNRSGVPLIEIVTEPDIKSAAQAKEYAKKLRQIIRYLDIGDCDMERGGMRLEANTSLRKSGEKDLPNYKVEVKNINSFRFLEQAIEFEMERQAKILETGETPVQETRGWNPTKSQSFSQRVKEDAADYRYFQDPDIPPIRLNEVMVEQLRKEIPELPETKAARWLEYYGVEVRFGELLAAEPELGNLFDQVFELTKAQNLNSNQLASDATNKKLAYSLTDTPASIVASFQTLHATSEFDADELASTLRDILAQFPTEVTRYQTGETKLLNFFFGQVMRQLKSKVPAEQLRAVIEDQLK